MAKSYNDILSKNLSALNLEQSLSCVGTGWRELLENMYGYFTFVYNNYGIFVIVEQVKEKFGGLRVYYSIDTAKQRSGYDVDLIHQTVLSIENESFLICEDCGKSGTQKNIFGWIKTLCDDCYKETVKSDE